MNENEDKSKFEELSAGLDNEGNSLNEDEKNSPEFKEAAEDFKKIDSALKTVSSAPQAPADMISKIATKCNEKPTISFTRELYKVVAILAACLVLTFIYKNEDQKSDKLAKVTEDNSEKKTQPVLSPLSEENDKVLEALRENPNSSTPSENFDLIGTNPKEGLNSAVSLGEEVKHVWVANDPHKTVMFLQKLTGLVDPLTTKADAKGNYKFSLSLTDSELVKLVSKLSEAGNSLLSKEFPQPGQINKITTSGVKVRYNVSILQEK